MTNESHVQRFLNKRNIRVTYSIRFIPIDVKLALIAAVTELLFFNKIAIVCVVQALTAP